MSSRMSRSDLEGAAPEAPATPSGGRPLSMSISGLGDSLGLGGGSVSVTGKVRLGFLLHTMPPDPAPIAMLVRVLEARDLPGGGGSGSSGSGGVSPDPYVRIKASGTRGEAACTADGKVLQLNTRWASGTTSPRWFESALLLDRQASQGDEAANSALERLLLEAAPLLAEGTPAAAANPSAPAAASPWEALRASQRAQLELSAPSAKQLLFGVRYRHAHAALVDEKIGEVCVPVASLIGDEAAVICDRSVRVDRWFRIRPKKSVRTAAASAAAPLGDLRLEITALFALPLLPKGWREFVDPVSNKTVYQNVSTGARQSEEPTVLTEWRQRSNTATAGALDPRPAVLSDDLSAVPAWGSEFSPSPMGSASGSSTFVGGSVFGVSSLGGSRISSVVVGSKPAEADAPASAYAAGPPVHAVLHHAPGQTAGTRTSLTGHHFEGVKEGANEEAEDDDDDDGVNEEALQRAQETLKRMDPFGGSGGGGRTAAIPTMPVAENPLAALGKAPIDASDRERIFFEEMKRNAVNRKQSAETQQASRVATMTEEEKREWDKEQEANARREQRKSRMLHTQLGAFGASGAKSAMLASRRSVRMSGSSSAAAGGAN
jgi:hypothetical protein